MKTRALTTLATLALALAAQAQIVKPWWDQIIDEGQGSPMVCQPAFLEPLPSGAFVLGYAKTGATTSFDSGLRGLYRNGNTYFDKLLSPSNIGTVESPVESALDRKGQLTVVTIRSGGFDLEKFSPTGVSLWKTPFALTASSVSAAADYEENIYWHYISGGLHYVVKLNGANGQIMWTLNLNRNDTDFKAAKLAAGFGDSVFLVGIWTASGAGMRSFQISKAGFVSTFTTMPDPLPYSQVDAAVDSKGNLVMVGSCNMASTYYSKIVKFNPFTQSYEWTVNSPSYLSMPANAVVSKLRLDPQDNIVVAGHGGWGTGNMQLTLMRMNPTGQVSFAKVFGTSDHETLYDMTLDRFGEAYLLAKGGSTAYITKHSTGGTQRWGLYTNTSGSMNPDRIRVFDRSGDIMVSSTLHDKVNNVDRTRISLHGYQQAPVAIPDAYTVPKNTIYTSKRPVVDNDRFPLGIGVQVVTPPSNGTLQLSHTGNFVYTPNAGFTGTDSFVYRLARPGFSTTQATCWLTVK